MTQAWKYSKFVLSFVFLLASAKKNIFYQQLNVCHLSMENQSSFAGMCLHWTIFSLV